MPQFTVQIKSKLRGDFYGQEKLKRALELEYYWKLMLLPVMMPLFNRFYHENGQPFHNYSVASPELSIGDCL
jgi:hypothetical protein